MRSTTRPPVLGVAAIAACLALVPVHQREGIGRDSGLGTAETSEAAVSTRKPLALQLPGPEQPSLDQAEPERAPVRLSAEALKGSGDATAPVGLPPGWTREDRQVSVATPNGDRSEAITFCMDPLGMEFVLVPAGEFMMGGQLTAQEVSRRWPGGLPRWYEGEHPRHSVTITRSLYMATTEVTRGQFAQFVRETGYLSDAERAGKAWALHDGEWEEHEGLSWRNPLFAQDDSHPVVCVSWEDSQAFCQWLAGRHGITYCLPTEAEWEYAARAGSETIWYWGNEERGAQGRADVAGSGEGVGWQHKFEGVDDGFTYTAPVGSFQPNVFGLHDMIGNAWEFCADWFGEDYYAESPVADPKGPTTGTFRVHRGGSWGSSPRDCRSAYRVGFKPSIANNTNGFRVIVRPVAPQSGVHGRRAEQERAKGFGQAPPSMAESRRLGPLSPEALGWGVDAFAMCQLWRVWP